MTDVPTPGASDRIAAIRASMSDDAEASAAFAEPIRVAIEAALARLDAIGGSAPHAEAIALLAHVRDRVSGLDPARLEPRQGLAGLFDSRGKRLKAFRAAYVSVADAASSGAADLADRSGAIVRRGDELEALWTDLRKGLTDLDDHMAAGRGWLAERTDLPPNPIPPEAAAAFEDTTDAPAERPVALVDEASGSVEAQADAEAHFETPAVEAEPPAAELAVPADAPEVEPTGLTGDAPAAPQEPDAEAVFVLPHPIEGRLATLDALRAGAVAALPRIRALQNADHSAPAALAQARDGIEAWNADWRDALGLAGKRPKKVRPDTARLVQSREALVGHLSAAERAVASAQARLAELAPRSATPSPEIRAAA